MALVEKIVAEVSTLPHELQKEVLHYEATQTRGDYLC
jgi:hypothetical protein